MKPTVPRIDFVGCFLELQRDDVLAIVEVNGLDWSAEMKWEGPTVRVPFVRLSDRVYVSPALRGCLTPVKVEVRRWRRVVARATGTLVA